VCEIAVDFESPTLQLGDELFAAESIVFRVL
jgi:hypothetical protein